MALPWPISIPRAARRAAPAALLLCLALRCPAHAFGEKKPLRVATKPLAPFVIFEHGHLTGFSIDLWDAVARKIGRTYTLADMHTTPDIIEAVRSGDADLGIAAVSMTAERAKVIDFSCPYFISGLQILVSRTAVTKHSGVGGYLLLLLTEAGHIALILASFFAVVALFAHIIWLCERRHNPDFSHGYLPGIADALWWSAQTFTTVGYGDKTPRRPVGRLFGILWMLIGCILFSYLTASVTTRLTLSGIHLEGMRPSDLAHWRVATVRGSTSAQFLAAEMIRPAEFGTPEEACMALQRGEADAVVYDYPFLSYYVAREGRGKVMLAGPVFHSEAYAVVLPNDSPHREAINCAILGLLEDGTWDKLNQKWLRPRTGR